MELLSLLLLLLIGSCGANDVLPEGPVDERLGSNVTLKTLLTAPDYMLIVWTYSDGTDMSPVVSASPTFTDFIMPDKKYKGRVTVDAATGALTLTQLTAADSGDYSISITSPTGQTKSGETKLRVLESVSAVTISSSPAEAIEGNSTVVLTCSSKGSFLRFSWTNGTAPLQPDGTRVQLQTNETSSILSIRNVLRTDLRGPIYCTASNSLDTERSAPFNRSVFYGPDVVSITPAAPPLYILSGSSFNLSCAAASEPAATYTWLQDGKKLAEGPVLRLETVEGPEKKLGRTAAGYSCQAANAKTRRSDSSPTVTFSVMEGISGVVISGPTSTLIAGKSSANISCSVASGTPDTVTWTKDGKTLAPGGRVLFSADQMSVAISELQRDDHGSYSCKISNAVSSKEQSYKMVVNFGPEEVQVSGPEAVEVSDAVTLTCSAPSTPPSSISWKFNGTLTDVTTETFRIPVASYKNSGVYTCQASNSVTGKSGSSTHSLSVKEEGALDEGLSDGAIAGIVIGVLAAVALAIGLVFYCRQKVPVESPY